MHGARSFQLQLCSSAVAAIFSFFRQLWILNYPLELSRIMSYDDKKQFSDFKSEFTFEINRQRIQVFWLILMFLF